MCFPFYVCAILLRRALSTGGHRTCALLCGSVSNSSANNKRRIKNIYIVWNKMLATKLKRLLVPPHPLPHLQLLHSKNPTSSQCAVSRFESKPPFACVSAASIIFLFIFMSNTEITAARNLLTYSNVRSMFFSLQRRIFSMNAWPLHRVAACLPSGVHSVLLLFFMRHLQLPHAEVLVSLMECNHSTELDPLFPDLNHFCPNWCFSS